MTARTGDAVRQVLAAFDLAPVLIDVGASGSPPPQWAPIAPFSVYVGFDPDRRELHEIEQGTFRRGIIVNRAVVPTEGQSQVHFYLTRSPFCSSALRPDAPALAQFLFADLFEVTGEADVPSQALGDVVRELRLDRIDWFKADSQGMDLRLFHSIPEPLRSRILAVDLEPGLIDAYEGEDLFTDAQAALSREGFWLSHIDVRGTPRMRRAAVDTLAREGETLGHADYSARIRETPAWCEARWLRTIEWLADTGAEARYYALLWVFALCDDQTGFAIDVSMAYEARFGRDHVSTIMRVEPLRRIQSINVQHNRRGPLNAAWRTLRSAAARFAR